VSVAAIPSATMMVVTSVGTEDMRSAGGSKRALGVCPRAAKTKPGGDRAMPMADWASALKSRVRQFERGGGDQHQLQHHILAIHRNAHPAAMVTGPIAAL
jgi:hypothetical protein